MDRPSRPHPARARDGPRLTWQGAVPPPAVTSIPSLNFAPSIILASGPHGFLRDSSGRRLVSCDFVNIVGLAIRVRNFADDLHRPVAHDLVQASDAILLPLVRDEVGAREDCRIRAKTVRSMLGPAHDRSRGTLEWTCRKHGKRLVLVDRHLGGAKTVSDGDIVADRDMNGAGGGVMLRALYGSLGRLRAAGDEVALVAE